MSLPKPRRQWKKMHPRNIQHAMELCLLHAREKKNLSVERVADRMGIASHWTLYKWMESGKMPAVSIRSFEHACGIDFVTRYIAASDHKLLIPIPSGKRSNGEDINMLQSDFTAAMTLLYRFYNEDKGAEETMAALGQVLSGVAWQQENVRKHTEPELSLFDGGAE